jgi:hypothetical protein
VNDEAEKIRQAADRVNAALHDSDEPLTTAVVLSGLAIAVSAVAAVEVTRHDRPLNPEEAQKAERIIDLIGKTAKMAILREDLS